MKPMITLRPMMNARRSILMTLVAGTALVTAGAAASTNIANTDNPR